MISDTSVFSVTKRVMFYQALNRFLVRIGIFFHFKIYHKKVSTWHKEREKWKEISLAEKKKRRIWFHAASAGELETLCPLILRCVELLGEEVVITVFSDSAMPNIKRIEESLISRKSQLLFVGHSPWEGRWEEALMHMSPSLFITVKYEAWPDLWMSLSRLKIPLWIVGAKSRRSLCIVKWICRFLGSELPPLVLLPSTSREVLPLMKLFPKARINTVGEPRWDRVYERITLQNLRIKEMVQFFEKQLPRPWGVLGNIWIEDLLFWKTKLNPSLGNIWVVPHEVESQSIRKIEGFLKKQGFKLFRTTQFSKNTLGKEAKEEGVYQTHSICLLVDEVGVLTELYSFVDWAFVGGGFGKGVHSMIEPALNGIPIASGPNGISQFTEIAELVHTGQMNVLRKEAELQSWLNQISQPSSANKMYWLQCNRSQLGATEKILHLISAFD